MILRAGLLALTVLLGGIGTALAHALPGSVLVLREQESGLGLTIQFPVEDLIIAAPELAALAEARPGQRLPPELAAALARYLRRHLALTEGAARLDLTMTGARIQSAYHDHLGHFLLVTSQCHMAFAEARPTSLVLTYDAVMHEVRNHRATVHWFAQNGRSHPIAEFGYYGAEDGVPLVPLEAGQE